MGLFKRRNKGKPPVLVFPMLRHLMKNGTGEPLSWEADSADAGCVSHAAVVNQTSRFPR